MPSIAQQDYLHIVQKGPYDCGTIARLLHGIERGTIFDTILTFIGDDNVSKIMGYNKNDGDIAYLDALNGEIRNIALNADFTATQYEGLAAIQDALDDYVAIPVFAQVEGEGIYDIENDCQICVDNKWLKAIIADGTISAVEISDIPLNPNDIVNIAWEDAQKLIGLPIV